jgi:putative peptidoglycan lipid II flippase
VNTPESSQKPKKIQLPLPAAPPTEAEALTGELPVPAPPRPVRRMLISNTLIVMLATVASRFLGLFREMVVAARFGTSTEYDTYVAAFRIPDLLYLIIIGGALGSALIPVFSRFLGQGEEQKAWRLANAVITTSVVVLVIVSFQTFIIAPQLVSNLLLPVADAQQQALAVNLTRLLLLQPLLLGLGGIAMALLNGTQHFLWPALAPLFYNGCIILGALFLTDSLGVYGMAIGVVIGAGIYFLVQIPALLRLGLRYRPNLDFRAPGLGEVLKVLGPRLVGQAAFQFNFFIITNLASRLTDGSISALNYAFQLFMLPHGIFAMSVATVTFPTLARLYGAKNMTGLKETLVGALRQIIFFALPASLGLALLARPVVATLFQLGRFGKTSTEMVSQTLVFFTVGLLAYGIVEIVTRAFYAVQDTRTTVIVAVLTVGINLLLSGILGREQTLGTGGLALSLALATTFEMVALLWLLRRKLGPFTTPNAPLLLPLVKIFLAADFMAAILWLVLQFVNSLLVDANKIILIIFTLFMIGIGAAAYGGAAYILGLEELKTALRRFLRR